MANADSTLEFVKSLKLPLEDEVLVCAVTSEILLLLQNRLALATVLKLTSDPIKVHKAIIAALVKATDCADTKMAEIKQRMGL